MRHGSLHARTHQQYHRLTSPHSAADPNGFGTHLGWRSISQMPHRLLPDIGRRHRHVGAVVSDHRPTLPPHRPGSARNHLPPREHSDRSAMLSGWTSPHPNGWHRALASRTGTSSRRDNKRRRMRVDCSRSHLVKDVPIYRKIPHRPRETLHRRLLLTWRSLFSRAGVIHATTMQSESADGIAWCWEVMEELG